LRTVSLIGRRWPVLYPWFAVLEPEARKKILRFYHAALPIAGAVSKRGKYKGTKYGKDPASPHAAFTLDMVGKRGFQCTLCLFTWSGCQGESYVTVGTAQARTAGAALLGSHKIQPGGGGGCCAPLCLMQPSLVMYRGPPDPAGRDTSDTFLARLDASGPPCQKGIPLPDPVRAAISTSSAREGDIGVVEYDSTTFKNVYNIPAHLNTADKAVVLATLVASHIDAERNSGSGASDNQAMMASSGM